MNNTKVKMGTLSPSWEGNGHIPRTITFCVTESCNLACKYCYMTGKNNTKKMTFETAKKAVDYILNDRKNFNEGAVIWEFIGGEPTIEMELIDRISDYIKRQMLLLDHPWFDAYKFNFSSNGILYKSNQVQNYIKKNRGHISFGISLDGNKAKHDMQRIYPDGSGSYDDVIRNIPLWIEQFGDVSTKSTFSHDDLPYVKDSIISLWDLGIKVVSANVVFEDVWEDGDEVIFESQLKDLADYIIDNKLWNEYSVRFFDPNIGFPLNEEDKERNFCGAGKMLAIDCDGNFYPCIRFLDFSLNNQKGLCVGNKESGLNTDKLRPFHSLKLKNQSKKECIECDVATGCAWCTGFNYDCSDTGTIYQRTTYICKMHKANVRACEYFWNKYSEVTGEKSRRDEILESRQERKTEKYLQFITEDKITPHCNYRNKESSNMIMSKDVIDKGIKFAKENGYTPVFLGNQDGKLQSIYKDVLYILDSSDKNISSGIIALYDNSAITHEMNLGNVATLIIASKNLSRISEYVKEIYSSHNRINIVLEEIEKWNDEDIKLYKNQLDKIACFILECFDKEKQLEINVLTDRINLKSPCDCDAGNTSITLAPDGKFYICPAFYFDNPSNSIGDIDNGLNINNVHLLERENAPICLECDAYHCSRCKFLNKKLTGEINTPSKIQCVISNIERNTSKELQSKLLVKGVIHRSELISESMYIDPLEKIKDREGRRL